MAQALRVIVLEDNDIHVRLTERELEQVTDSFTIKHVVSEADFTAALKEFSPDIILADYHLPDFDGLSALKIALRLSPDVPFIIVSGSVGEETAIDIVKAGATDYVLKTRMSRLVPAVQRALQEVRDIAKRKQAEKSLLESEERFRQLAENIREVFWMTDPSKKHMMYISPGYEVLWGRTCQSLYEFPSSFLESIHPEDRIHVIEALPRQIEGTYDQIYRIIRPDGSLRWIRDRAFPVNDSEGRLYRVVGIAEDITQLKQTAEELQVLNESLERKVAERTAELQRGSRELTLLNEELKQFVNVASHDLKEPLRTIANYAQLLESRYRGKFDKSADEFIDYIVKGVNRIYGLLDVLLSYSRLSDGVDRFSNPTDCQAVFENAVSNLTSAISESHAVITHDFLPTVRGDDFQLVQVFQNLIGNAIKFKNSSVPRIHIAALAKEDEWQFSVSDNGIGIEPEFFDRIFVIFKRLHSREKYAGDGMGLTICKKIIEHHGGKIWVESEPGKGTTFHFTLLKFKDAAVNANE